MYAYPTIHEVDDALYAEATAAREALEAEINPWSHEAREARAETREARCRCRPGRPCLECAEALAENHL